MTFSVKLTTLIASAFVNGSVLNWSAQAYVRGVLKGKEMYSWDE